ncbi:MAG: response regulator [Candidatus Omnitrophica bacterium]|nr:response regulator [Candidatus Omnitrophota bacterium]
MGEMVKKKVLIVDDEESLAKMIRLNLEDSGRYEVQVETFGSKAFAAAKEFKPDIIFLDIVMPDLEGSEVAFQIREDSEIGRIPIVFMTATVIKEEIGPDGRIGGHPFLAKPVGTEDLVRCIERFTS